MTQAKLGHYFNNLDSFMGVVIVANAVAIGLEQEFGAQEDAIQDEKDRRGVLYVCTILESVFLVAYILELCYRFKVLRWGAFKKKWILFDMTIVLGGVLNEWILFPLLGRIHGINLVLVLRSLRLLRLARLLRLLNVFKDLWLLVRSFTSSGSTVFNVFILATLILYISACTSFAAVQGINVEDYVYKEVRDAEFPTVAISWLTMVDFLFADKIVNIYRPLALQSALLTAYFMLCILIISILLFTMVEAVIVETALERAESDREEHLKEEEEKRKHLVGTLKKLCMEIDEDGSGFISLEELEGMGEVAKSVFADLLPGEDPRNIFTALDSEGEDELSINKFCHGILRIMEGHTSIEVLLTGRHLMQIGGRLEEFEATQELILAELGKCRRQQARILRSVEHLGSCAKYQWSRL